MICSLPKKCGVKWFRALGAMTLCQSRTFTASALLQPRKTCNPLVLVFVAVQQNIGGGFSLSFFPCRLQQTLHLHYRLNRTIDRQF